VALSLARSVMTEQRPTSTNGAEAFPPDSRYRAGESSSRPKYSRVLLKLGGEMFGGGADWVAISRAVAGEKIGTLVTT
jgi:hypothetical protein